MLYTKMFHGVKHLETFLRLLNHQNWCLEFALFVHIVVLGAVAVGFGGFGALGAGLGCGLAPLDFGVVGLMDGTVLAVGTCLVLATGAFFCDGLATSGGRQGRCVLHRVGCDKG